MNMILVKEEDFIGDESTVRLTGRRFRHIKDILHAKKGDALKVGELYSRIGSGEVVSLSERAVDIKVDFTDEPPDPLPVTLCLALPRPIVLKRLLMNVTTLGVKKIILFHSRRVEKSYWQSPWLKEEKIEQQLILGLEQAGDTVLPEVILKKRFKPFVEDDLPLIAKASHRLLAHPGMGSPCPMSVRGDVTLCIGPEGGFNDFEVELFQEKKFQPVELGRRILKVETAVTAFLARLF